jgi:hypothetical protein
MEIAGGNGAPINMDGNRAARVFWERWVHEMFKETEMDGA